MDDRAVRQARNETLHREVNEQLAKLDKQANSAWADENALFEFLCECGAGDECEERVKMKLADYDRVRQQDDRFAVVPGHESPRIERVVGRTEAFLIVDKIVELEPFVSDDPRGAPS